MEGIFKKLILHNAQRKIFSVVAAIVIWIFINSAITSTKVFPRIAVRVVNLPSDKTVRGLMPNGILERRITLTISGTKDVIDRLDSQDFEIVIDASDKGNDWIVQLSKKNLVSLNPDIELMNNITGLAHPDFLIHLSKLVTEKIPVHILPPKGEPPEGYQFLDIWPQKLYQIVSGPEEDVHKLKENGVELTFDLSNISKDELDTLLEEQKSATSEIGFPVPDSWKKISIPFLHHMLQSMNGPEAKQLRIDFLKKSVLPINTKIPIRIYYPPSSLATINPTTLALAPEGIVTTDQEVLIVSSPLSASGASNAFLEVVRDKIEIVVVPILRSQGSYHFSWQTQFIEPDMLEDAYVLHMMPTPKSENKHELTPQTEQKALPTIAQHQVLYEKSLRARFQEYMQRFRLFCSKEDPLELEIKVENKKVIVTSPCDQHSS